MKKSSLIFFSLQTFYFITNTHNEASKKKFLVHSQKLLDNFMSEDKKH